MSGQSLAPPTIKLRAPLVAPVYNNPLQLIRNIRFRHPGYESGNILFVLRGSDRTDDSTDVGLHHETARLACAIVADNRWDGYLSTSRTGPPVSADQVVLLGSDYFFIVPGPRQDSSSSSSSRPDPTTNLPSSSSGIPYNYPIVPSFREWLFPLETLPGLWGTLPRAGIDPIRSSSSAVMDRDVSCRITDYKDESDGAHLCPRAEKNWFRDNEMDQYAIMQRRGGDAALHDGANMLLLRADLHRAFDKKQFVFVPKAEGVICTHILGESIQARALYHNTPLLKADVAPQYLFARFAWAIFPYLSGFLHRRISRLIKLAARDEADWIDGEECAEYGKSSTGQSRNASPQKSNESPKRRRPNDEQDEFGETHDDGESDEGPTKRRKTASSTHHQEWDADSQGAADEIVEASDAGDVGQTVADLKPTIVESRGKSRGPSSSVPPRTTSRVLMSEGKREEKRERGRIRKLIKEMLERERARSDPGGTWEKEVEWRDWILDNGGAIDSKEIVRFFLAGGDEVRDENF